MLSFGQQESLSCRGILILVNCFALFLLPTIASASTFSRRSLITDVKLVSSGSKQYAVIFDAGSTGSRVHVFLFDPDLNLLPVVGNEPELYQRIEPGLSAYPKDPEAAANSLLPLLEKAEDVIPEELQTTTPVKLGATAGLRQLKDGAAENILQAVRNLLKNKSNFKFNPDWVTIIDGSEEGSYQWITINYLLGNLGKPYSGTVGTVDLGGGSVQMTYAITDEAARQAPRPDGNDTYVKEMHLKGTEYYLYAHSYLRYGLFAARAEILKVTGKSDNPCVLTGYNGIYNYNGAVYNASSSQFGASISKCKRVIRRALKINSPCSHPECTFSGVWNGGGGDGQKNLYVGSNFYYKPADVGLIDSKLPTARVRVVDFDKAAKRACKTDIWNVKSTYPNLRDAPFICMDLTYEYTLLVDGFGLKPFQEITLVKQVAYQGHLVDAAWPLGSAIEAVSSEVLLRDHISG